MDFSPLNAFTTAFASDPSSLRLDRREQIIGSAIVKEEHALSDAPQRRGAELVRAGRA